MSVVRRGLVELLSLPRLMQIGLFVLVVGGSLDILFHASPSDWTGALETYLGPDGYYAHVVTLIGMLVTLAGLWLPRRLSHRPHTRMQHSE